MNRKIRVGQVRLIGEDGRQFGIVNTAEAMKVAEEASLDLVEVAPDVNPLVCRIMDYSRFKYEQEKKERESKKKQHRMHLKELTFGPLIEEHDYQVKLNHLMRFLKRGDKIKVTMRFRGRQMQHIDLGRNVLIRLAKDISDIGEEERAPVLDGRFMSTVFFPKAVK